MDFNKDHSGYWQGEIVLGKNYREMEGTRISFDLEIAQYHNQISGVAIDTGGHGASPDEAGINGTISGKEIHFVKQYVHEHFFQEDGSLYVDESRAGHLTNYSGIYHEDTNSFSGTWRIRGKFRLLGIIPISYNGGEGTWHMQRKP